MCGIGGVMAYPKDRSEYELEYIRLLTRGIASENQVRGRDSTGVAVFGRKNEHLVLKHPMKATDFVASATYGSFMEKNVTRHTRNILIHTRAGTKGSEQNNDNNHPIITQRYIGVHNGMIWNDDSLFKSESLFRQAEVDSEVIFRLLDKYGQTLDGVKKVSETVSGAFTFAAIAKERTNELFLVKHNNPVTMAYIPEFNIIAFASEKLFLERSIKAANAEFNFDNLVDMERITWFEPKYNTIMRFDVLQNNPLAQLEQEPTSFVSSYDYGNSYNWYDDGEYFYGSRYSVLYSKKNEEEVEANIIAGDGEARLKSIMEKLTEEEVLFLQAEIEAQCDLSWNTGYNSGRKSLAEEMGQVRSFAFEKGYETGQDDGYEEGWIDAKAGKGYDKVIGTLPEPKVN